MSNNKIAPRQKTEQLEDRSKILEHWERKGLLDDLHDLINWYHSGVVTGLDAMTVWIDRNDIEKVKSLAPEVLQNAKSVVRELRNIHSTLISQYLELDNLRDALTALIQMWTERTIPKHDKPLSINLECSQDLVIPVPLQNKILKIASSALSNAILHSGVIENPKIKIYIKLQQTTNHILLIVEDNGVGTEKIAEGYGVTRIRELVNQLTFIGYTTKLEIVSELGKGTKVTVLANLSNGERHVE